jgi:hypothetical protein
MIIMKAEYLLTASCSKMSNCVTKKRASLLFSFLLAASFWPQGAIATELIFKTYRSDEACKQQRRNNKGKLPSGPCIRHLTQTVSATDFWGQKAKGEKIYSDGVKNKMFYVYSTAETNTKIVSVVNRKAKEQQKLISELSMRLQELEKKLKEYEIKLGNLDNAQSQTGNSVNLLREEVNDHKTNH